MLETLRQCLFLLGPSRRARWAVVVVLALVASAFEVGGAVIVFWLLHRITTEASGFEVPLLGDLREVFPGAGEEALMAGIGAAVALFFVARAATIALQTYIQYRLAENAGATLASRLLGGYLSMPYSFHLQRNSSELIRNSYETVQQFVREALTPAVKLATHSVIAAGLIGVLLVTSPRATFFALVVLTTLAWLLVRFIHPRVKALGGTAQEMAKTTLQTLDESLAGWRDIKVLGREAFFVEQFAADRRRLARARYLRATARELPRLVLETGLVLFILVFLAVSVAVEGGALGALPVLGLFGYVAVRLQPSLNEIMVALNSLKFVGPGLELMQRDMLLVAGQGASRRTAVEPLPLQRELRLDGVSARYPGGQREALADVDVTIEAGEFVGIVGATGSGKTTLVDVMLGLLEPTAGRVLIDGVDLRGRVEGWHASLGVVHQVVFLADTTLRRNVALGMADEAIDDALVAEAVRLAQLDGLVAGLPEGLDTVVGQRGIRLSGGERQRLAIARALYRRPSVLVFDEGTSALDNRTETELMAALAPLRGERTIIAVAHRLSTVAACNRVLLVDGGRLVDAAPFAELALRHAELLPAPR